MKPKWRKIISLSHTFDVESLAISVWGKSLYIFCYFAAALVIAVEFTLSKFYSAVVFFDRFQNRLTTMTANHFYFSHNRPP
jgi:hypothetical protein